MGLTACSRPPEPPPAPGSPIPEIEGTAPTPAATPVPIPPEKPTPTPEPSPSPLVESFIPRRAYDTARLFNGLKIYSHLQSLPGGIAPLERVQDESFSVDISLKVKVPAAMATVDDFLIANPEMTKALPMLEEILKHGRVSPYYHSLYALKVKSLQQDLGDLNEILSRHNFFDCGTILELTNPTTKRKALLLQADMDVVADGSDSDRFLEVDGTSTHYQPFTSYRWPKKTATPSQFLPDRESKIRAAQAELAIPGIKPERERALRSAIATNKLDIADLQQFSFLIAKADPFIVLPGFMIRDKSLPFCPRIGDYAAVIFGSKIYPAIFGDVGPSVKVGEASLRLATALNLKATAANRPTNKLDVSYLVFPKTAEADSSPPDYEKWRSRCIELLTEIGVPDVSVEHWENNLPPLPTPTPTPDPALVLPAPRTLEMAAPTSTPTATP